VEAKLSNWKATALSKAGRAVLIQSNLEALPAHTMQCFQLSATVTQRLDQVNQEFFWKKSSTEKGFPLVAWDKVCKQKKIGALGIRKASAVNTVFLGKLGWKYLTQPDNF